MMQDPNANFFQTQRAFELYWQNRPIEKGSGFKPFKRWEYNTAEIVDDQGNIPSSTDLEKIVQTYISSHQKGGTGGGVQMPGVPTGPASCLTEGNWIELGPKKLSGNRTGQPNGLGRVNSLAFHPNDSNIIYAGTPAGGIWISKDRGSTWSSNTDTLPTLGVSSIAVDPFSPDTIYIGTGDRDAGDSYSRGVMRSVDGGVTWQSANTGMGNVTVGRLIVDPRNNGVLIAATSSGIYRSTNHGNNWSRSVAGNFKEVVMNPANSNLIYAATYATAKYYRSTNNGAAFTQITTGLAAGKRRMVIGVSPHDSNFVYVLITNSRTYQGIYLSTDKGLTFTQMSNKPNIMDYSTNGSGTSGQAWYDLDIAIDPYDKASIYVGGVNIFKSTDSGKTWKINAHWVGSGGAPPIHADQHVLEYDFTQKRLYVGNDGGVYFTADGGKKYTDISEGIGNAQIYRLGQSQRSKDMVINGYQDNGTGLYEFGSWYTIMGGDGMDCVIDPTDNTWAYSDLYYGDVRRFKNGRYNAQIAKNGKNGITESGGWVTPFVLQEGTPKTMFIGYKNVWRTTNCQANPPTWKKISNNVAGSNSQNISYLESSPKDPKILYVARSGNKFFKTTDVNAATPTWTDLTSKLPNASAVYWIESHHKKANTIWISQSNKVYQSDDGGNTWSNISNGLPNLRILSIAFDSSSKNEGMYAGTYMGVFYRDTVLKKWVWFNNGMPTYTRVRDIEIYYSPSGRSKSHVICATYGRGNWRSPLYDEDQKAPVASFEVSDTFGCVGQYFKLSDSSENLPTRWKWEIRPSTVSYLNGTDSCSQYPEFYFTTAGSYTVKMVSENCIGKDSVSKNLLVRIEQGPKPAQCDGYTTSLSQKMGVYSLNIDTSTFTSDGANVEGGYLDFSCTKKFYLKTDTNYDVNVLTGITYNENIKLFVDFNDNGKLDDASEWFESKSAKRNHKFTLSIPANAVTSKALRLRIMSDYDTVTANPCDTLRYGQTEDYGVILELRKPEPDFAVSKDSVCVGESVVISDSSEGSILSRKWYFYGDASLDSTTGIGPHSISYSSPGHKKIRLVVNNGEAEKSIDSVIYVKATPNLGLNLALGNATGCENRLFELSITDSNQVASTFTWQRESAQVKSGSDTFYQVTSAAMADSGSYFAIASYLGCIDTSESLLIEVDPTPRVSFTVNTDSQCFKGNNFSFTNTSSIVYGGFLSNWDFADGSFSTNANPTKSYIGDGQYKVKLVVESLKGCKDSATNDISVWPSPASVFELDTNKKCFYQHQFATTNKSTISSGVLSYTWDFGDGTNSSIQDPTKSYASVGTRQIELIVSSAKGCRDTSAQQVEVFSSPLASFTVNSLVQCFNNHSYTFTNNSGLGSGVSHTYDWDLDDGSQRSSQDVTNYSYASAGSYDVVLTVESSQGCIDDTTIAITVGASPLADFDIVTPSNCLNEHRVTLNQKSTIASGSISGYQWDFGDGNSGSSANPTAFAYAAEGQYFITLIAETSTGCNDTLEKSVEIYPSPLANFVVSNACIGEEVQVTDMSSISTGTMNYLYTFEPGKISIDQNPTYVYSTQGNKTVNLVLTSDMACADTFEQVLDVYALPVADFDHAKTGSDGKNTDIQFNDQSSLDATAWSWDFQAAGSSGDQNPLVTFSDTGSFTIQLIVENANGCKDTNSKQVFVFPHTVFHIVNSFTPNNDNLNDKFELVGLDFVDRFTLRIYNRWGEQLYVSEDPKEQWDGTYQNELLPSGFYVYVIEFRDLSGLRYKEKGEVFLIR